MIRRSYLIGAVLTALWLFLVWFYVESEVGWTNMSYMLPWENLVFGAAVLVPVGLIWLIVAFVELAERSRINRDALFELAQQMADATPEARQEAKMLSAEIAKQVSNLANLAKTSESTRRDIAKLGAEAEKALNAATERTSADAAEIRRTYEGYVGNVSKMAEDAAGRIRKTIETSIESTFTDDLKTTVAKLEGESTTITTASRDFAKRIEDVETLFDGHRVKLAEATARATAQAGEIRSAFGAQSQQLGETAELMSTRITQVQEALEKQISLLKRSGDSVVTQIETLDKKSIAAGRTVESIGTELRKLVDKTIDNELSRVGAATDEAGKQIKNVADEIARTLDVALKEQLQKMERTAAKLNDDIGTLNETMSHSTDHLESVVKTTAEEAQQTVNLFRNQVEELSEATREAAEQTDAVREAVAQGRRDGFLRASATVIRELNELAVDIDQVFEPSLPDNIMKLYKDGDHGIFVRRLARANDEHSVPLIRETMRKNSDFRHSVSTFMKRYEALLAQTADCDPDRILTATLLSADVGKVYMLLARADQRDH
ncbi:MAG: hypothetical protein GY791_12295 [Alphaproteobacteria bacterium]|nr:hypothetical protein [Alphaproteobacteria bacterium]